MKFLQRKSKNLGAQEADGYDSVDESGGITENAKAQQRQRMLMWGLGGVIALTGCMYIFDSGDSAEGDADKPGEVKVSTDALMNRQKVDQEWVANYEYQVNNQGAQIESLQKGHEQLMALEGELDALRQENANMARDGKRVLEAYERENQRLRRQTQENNSRPPAPGPTAAAQAVGLSPPVPAGAAVSPVVRSNDVQMVSFESGGGTASRIDPSDAPAVYTDSPNYLPPNSIAKATVVVGVDAVTNTRSQSDPLPVLLRVTGPARSVYGDGRLLATRVQGCMVNGAAYGDLSSEKVYVKLQRMTCWQPDGRYAVSEVKGFIAFGGKVGVRGRVVSREGSLTTQAFLAGLVSSAGSALNQSFNQPIIQGNGRENPSVGEIGLRGLGGGAQQAGRSVSDYLIERAEQYQPVIEMPTGADVEVVFLDGTFIRN